MRVLVSFITFLWVGNVFAAEPVYTSFFSNKALGGYDSVAYFTQAKPIPGNKAMSFQYKGVKWLFSSAENLAKFKANPTKYAPQYGGYCAWAVAAKSDLVAGDPLRWNIIENKLYLNYDKNIQTKWQKDISGFIKKADQTWPKLVMQ
ncbi:MAG: YHS domain-containing protein [Oceanospirillaceae bacterium]|nr:YHS domain-containing protein [Oceanospirillaceae bacterium]